MQNEEVFDQHDTIGLSDDIHIGCFIDGKQILVDSVPIASKPFKFNVSGDTLFMTDVPNLLIYNKKERKVAVRLV